MARDEAHSGRGGAGRWITTLLAILLAALGIVLLAGGIWLIVLDGSWYYAIAGAGLIATAVPLARSERTALGIYALVWLFTLAWTIWEVQFDWWAWAPRMVAPTVILVILALCAPLLTPRRALRRRYA